MFNLINYLEAKNERDNLREFIRRSKENFGEACFIKCSLELNYIYDLETQSLGVSIYTIVFIIAFVLLFFQKTSNQIAFMPTWMFQIILMIMTGLCIFRIVKNEQAITETEKEIKSILNITNKI